MKKVYLIANQDQRTYDIRNWFKQNSLSHAVILTAKPAEADFFIVAGGDGALLSAIRGFRKYNKPFFGVHRGTSGALLNRIDTADELAKVLKNFSKLSLVKLRLLRADFITGRNAKKNNFYAFNDFYVKSARGNERIIGTVRGNKNFLKQEFDGDGLIISTPQGSTAYNFTAGGKILPLKSAKLAVKSICSRKDINKIISGEAITVEINRGRAVAYADHSWVIKDVKKMVARPTKETVTLAFKPGYNFKVKC